jgi:extracellular elastinolytic metalloproteinase
MTWDGILFADGREPNRPPCVRRLDSGLTYESFDHSAAADEHANGEIWSATLWDIWSRLGRGRADRLIIESHFQLDGFTSFAKGARAIVDADRNLFRGRQVTALKQIFRRRGIGPVE